MINIDNELRKAIADAAEEQGSVLQLATRINKAHTTIRDWISGKTKRCSEEVFEKLLPYLQPHLSKSQYDLWMSNIRVKPFPVQESREDDEAIPLDLSKRRICAVPVISFAQAAGYEPALEPLCDYLRETSERHAVFIDVPENAFALEVSGDSMLPDYPDGSVALVASGEFPQRGDLVAAKLADGQVVMKLYQRKNNVIRLESINPLGKNFEWNCKEQPNFIIWMWPVIEITLKPRAKRWERSRMGL